MFDLPRWGIGRWLPTDVLPDEVLSDDDDG